MDDCPSICWANKGAMYHQQIQLINALLSYKTWIEKTLWMHFSSRLIWLILHYGNQFKRLIDTFHPHNEKSKLNSLREKC